MAFLDAIVMAVPEGNRVRFRKEARALAALFLDCGATEVVDAWERDVPEGKLTSFPLAVRREPGERVALGWVLWPSKRVRDRGWKQAMADPRMPKALTTYDGRRMIFGGFDIIQSSRREP